MAVQVSAHGFDMTPAIKEACHEEFKDRLLPIGMNNLSTRWSLSLEKEEHVAHVVWADGPMKGDCTVKTADMYSSIKQVSKKVAEQIKKAHAKIKEKRKEARVAGEPVSDVEFED